MIFVITELRGNHPDFGAGRQAGGGPGPCQAVTERDDTYIGAVYGNSAGDTDGADQILSGGWDAAGQVELPERDPPTVIDVSARASGTVMASALPMVAERMRPPACSRIWRSDRSIVAALPLPALPRFQARAGQALVRIIGSAVLPPASSAALKHGIRCSWAEQ